MISATQTGTEYVKPTYLVEFDRLAEAVDYDGEEMQENLPCVAMIYWEKAEKVADLSGYDRRMFARALASRNGNDAAGTIRRAIEDVRRRPENYRLVCVDDMRHLRLQAERDAALPLLETAANLLGMMNLGPAWFE